ncbi:hypothetical protein AMTRI_Chr08g203600 [Amborella trichopoda]
MAQIDGENNMQRTNQGGHELPLYNDHDDEHHHKKSVLAKVKDKAKKWRNTIVKKKNVHNIKDLENGRANSLSGYEQDDEAEEEDAEYHGAPMYESEAALPVYTRESQSETILPVYTQGIRATVSTNPQWIEQQNINKIRNNNNNNNKTLTETVTDMLAPAYAKVSEAASNLVASTINSPRAVDTSQELGGKQKWDKGVSMKEYLRHKLEPGQEERALSQVITEAISPRRVARDGDKGVVEKVKEAVTSLLWVEEQENVYVNHHGDEETQTQGRRLQAYTNCAFGDQTTFSTQGRRLQAYTN